MDKEGNEIKFFSSKFLVQKYLKYSSEDIKLNQKLKDQEIEELNLAGGDNGDEEMGGGDFGGGFGESIDYEKLSNMIVEKMSALATINENKEDKKETDVVDDDASKDKKKSSKKKSKK